MERVIVCGSREWTDRGRIFARLKELPPDSVIVHGACSRGADRIAHEEAKKLEFVIEEHPAHWHQYGKRAGFIRNEEMAIAGASRLLAFWDGASRGTKDMINRAMEHRIPVEIFQPEDAISS